jgi:UDP:flavonoid glycosyltransferase YjiC (YdhE family)
MVVIPITNEQPGIATRLVRTGAGQMVTLKKLNPAQLQAAISQVLNDASYRANAQRMQTIIKESGGVQRAADIIISVCPNRSLLF